MEKQELEQIVTLQLKKSQIRTILHALYSEEYSEKKSIEQYNSLLETELDSQRKEKAEGYIEEHKSKINELNRIMNILYLVKYDVIQN